MPCYSFRDSTVSATLKIALKFFQAMYRAIWWAQLQAGSSQQRGAWQPLTLPGSAPLSQPLHRPSTSWQLEQEAGSYWQTVAPGCGLPLMTVPAESWLSSCAFPSSRYTWEKRKGIPTPSLHSHPCVECSFWLFSPLLVGGSRLEVWRLVNFFRAVHLVRK